MQKKSKKFIFEAVAYVLFVSILIIGIPKGLSYYLQTPYPMATITSESMWPTLKKNDIVFIKKVDGKELKVGDVIVFKNGHGFTIHRIIEIGNGVITTKGDANNVSDLPINYNEIVGKALSWEEKPIRIPYIGNITIWASKYRS